MSLPVLRQETSDSSELASHQSASYPPYGRFFDLAEVAFDAAQSTSPYFFRSIFGKLKSWLPPHRPYSEYNIIDPWRPIRTLRYLADVSLPSRAKAPPDWARMLFPPFVYRQFWRPTGFFRQPDEYGGTSTFPDEHWFFINGVGTNKEVAGMNAAYLAHLFHRPLTVVQNSTSALLIDLYECALGKGFKTNPSEEDRGTMTEPAWRATSAILEALNEKHTRRVVILAHSQGTIILANVLRAVAKALDTEMVGNPDSKWHYFTDELMGGIQTQTQKVLRNNLAHSLHVFTKEGSESALVRLMKLEIYTFANCTDQMSYIYRDEEIPYMEHFANERDLVAQLGVLSRFRKDSSNDRIKIDGAVYVRKEAYGHLLNEHYLSPIDEHLYPLRSEERPPDPYWKKGIGLKKPRLYGYFHGKKPRERFPHRTHDLPVGHHEPI